MLAFSLKRHPHIAWLLGELGLVFHIHHKFFVFMSLTALQLAKDGKIYTPISSDM